MEKEWKGFIELSSKLRSKEDFVRFFDLFLTKTERKALAARFLVIKALLEGKGTHREIAEKFSVSPAFVARGQKALEKTAPDLRKFLKGNLPK